MGAKTLMTAQQFDDFPFEEDKRYELDEGEMIEMTRPAYDHNRTLKILLVEVELYLRANPIGEALISENLFALSPTIRRAPDLAIVLGDRRVGLPGSKVIHVVPDIVAEVLSPSETPRMINRKLRQYFDSGVKEAWLIDPASRTVEVWTEPVLPKTELTENDAVTSALLPGFSLPLATLFA